MYDSANNTLVFGVYLACSLYLFSLFYAPLGRQVERRVRLLRQAWFVVVPLILIAWHYTYLDQLSKNQNDIFVIAAQLGGAGFLLLSIDRTLGIYDRETVWSQTKNWVREFFRVRTRVHNVSVNASLGGLSIVSGVGLVTTSDSSLEGRIRQLEQKVDHLFSQLREQYKKLNERVTEEAQQIRQELSLVNQQVSKLESAVGEVTVGDLTKQIFGSILLAYGTIADRFLLP
jgi:hypothetical protein